MATVSRNMGDGSDEWRAHWHPNNTPLDQIHLFEPWWKDGRSIHQGTADLSAEPNFTPDGRIDFSSVNGDGRGRDQDTGVLFPEVADFTRPRIATQLESERAYREMRASGRRAMFAWVADRDWDVKCEDKLVCRDGEVDRRGWWETGTALCVAVVDLNVWGTDVPVRRVDDVNCDPDTRSEVFRRTCPANHPDICRGQEFAWAHYMAQNNIQGGDIHAEPFSEDWDFAGYSLYYPSSPEEPVRVTLAEAERVVAELTATAVPGTVAGFAWASDSDWTPCPTECGMPECVPNPKNRCSALRTLDVQPSQEPADAPRDVRGAHVRPTALGRDCRQAAARRPEVLRPQHYL